MTSDVEATRHMESTPDQEKECPFVLSNCACAVPLCLYCKKFKAEDGEYYEEFQRACVCLQIQRGISPFRICQKFGILGTDLKKWRAAHFENLQELKYVFPDAVKETVIRLIQTEGNKKKFEIASYLSLPANTITDWLQTRGKCNENENGMRKREFAIYKKEDGSGDCDSKRRRKMNDDESNKCDDEPATFDSKENLAVSDLTSFMNSEGSVGSIFLDNIKQEEVIPNEACVHTIKKEVKEEMDGKDISDLHSSTSSLDSESQSKSSNAEHVADKNRRALTAVAGNASLLPLSGDDCDSALLEVHRRGRKRMPKKPFPDSCADNSSDYDMCPFILAGERCSVAICLYCKNFKDEDGKYKHEFKKQVMKVLSRKFSTIESVAKKYCVTPAELQSWSTIKFAPSDSDHRSFSIAVKKQCLRKALIGTRAQVQSYLDLHKTNIDHWRASNISPAVPGEVDSTSNDRRKARRKGKRKRAAAKIEFDQVYDGEASASQDEESTVVQQEEAAGKKVEKKRNKRVISNFMKSKRKKEKKSLDKAKQLDDGDDKCPIVQCGEICCIPVCLYCKNFKNPDGNFREELKKRLVYMLNHKSLGLKAAVKQYGVSIKLMKKWQQIYGSLSSTELYAVPEFSKSVQQVISHRISVDSSRRLSISTRLDIHPARINVWVDEYEKSNGIKRRPGRPRKMLLPSAEMPAAVNVVNNSKVATCLQPIDLACEAKMCQNKVKPRVLQPSTAQSSLAQSIQRARKRARDNQKTVTTEESQGKTKRISADSSNLEGKVESSAAKTSLAHSSAIVAAQENSTQLTNSMQHRVSDVDLEAIDAAEGKKTIMYVVNGKRVEMPELAIRYALRCGVIQASRKFRIKVQVLYIWIIYIKEKNIVHLLPQVDRFIEKIANELKTSAQKRVMEKHRFKHSMFNKFRKWGNAVANQTNKKLNDDLGSTDQTASTEKPFVKKTLTQNKEVPFVKKTLTQNKAAVLEMNKFSLARKKKLADTDKILPIEKKLLARAENCKKAGRAKETSKKRLQPAGSSSTDKNSVKVDQGSFKLPPAALNVSRVDSSVKSSLNFSVSEGLPRPLPTALNSSKTVIVSLSSSPVSSSSPAVSPASIGSGFASPLPSQNFNIQHADSPSFFHIGCNRPQSVNVVKIVTDDNTASRGMITQAHMKTSLAVSPQESASLTHEGSSFPHESSPSPHENLFLHREVFSLPQESSSLPQESSSLLQKNQSLIHENTSLPFDSSSLPHESSSLPSDSSSFFPKSSSSHHKNWSESFPKLHECSSVSSVHMRTTHKNSTDAESQKSVLAEKVSCTGGSQTVQSNSQTSELTGRPVPAVLPQGLFCGQGQLAAETDDSAADNVLQLRHQGVSPHSADQIRSNSNPSKSVPELQVHVESKLVLLNQSLAESKQVEGEKILSLVESEEVPIGQGQAGSQQVQLVQAQAGSQQGQLVQAQAGSQQGQLVQAQAKSQQGQLVQAQAESQQGQLVQAQAKSQQGQLVQGQVESQQGQLVQGQVESQQGQLVQCQVGSQQGQISWDQGESQQAQIAGQGESQQAQIVGQGESQQAQIVGQGESQQAQIVGQGECQHAQIVGQGQAVGTGEQQIFLIQGQPDGSRVWLVPDQSKGQVDQGHLAGKHVCQGVVQGTNETVGRTALAHKNINHEPREPSLHRDKVVSSEWITLPQEPVEQGQVPIEQGQTSQVHTHKQIPLEQGQVMLVQDQLVQPQTQGQLDQGQLLIVHDASSMNQGHVRLDEGKMMIINGQEALNLEDGQVVLVPDDGQSQTLHQSVHSLDQRGQLEPPQIVILQNQGCSSQGNMLVMEHSAVQGQQDQEVDGQLSEVSREVTNVEGVDLEDNIPTEISNDPNCRKLMLELLNYSQDPNFHQVVSSFRQAMN